MKKVLVFIEVLLIASLLSMATVNAQDLRHNDDLKYIRDWKRNAKAADLAGSLSLSPEQVASLRGYRQNWDQVHTEMDPQLNAAKTALTEAAAGIRKQLEGGADLSPEQEEQLNALRGDIKRLSREKRLKTRLALNGIESVLEENQKESLKTFMRQERARNREGRRFSRENRVSREGRKDRAIQRAKRIAVRLILSDGFLNAYP
ncbi:hypothetical protein [Acanthopleuribacter pedis]|uniref:Periplasmic heavy metal sensor n=1 Tax=Acanthopleuribacter pedis TaxID=442870 RepID=A0A8J7U6C3_9BACT|nr:hypothetical protein [Acanthopleuribacter pedis]MBO1321313.1 hypothetical protein [Acanthopleuribacter pedis]